jgi:hypothetical protein
VRSTSVIGRIAPEDKRRVVEALRDDGRYVAMVGDGVNDVPAMKAARLAIAQGPGAQLAKSVADVVLLYGDLARVPGMVAEAPSHRRSAWACRRSSSRSPPAAGRGAPSGSSATSRAVAGLALLMAACYVAVLLVPVARAFLALARPDAQAVALAAGGVLLAWALTSAARRASGARPDR